MRTSLAGLGGGLLVVVCCAAARVLVGVLGGLALAKFAGAGVLALAVGVMLLRRGACRGKWVR
ncbi:MAG: hypothetical protein H0U12_05070 [Thermoleophilaceae bacterium]|nr:hypothetical protein [Thermoleophilaceae bacterium]